MSSGESVSSSLTRLTQLALLTKHRNIMGNLPAPIRSKLFNRYGNKHYQACVCSMQGYRANMEDSHLVHLSFKSHSEYSLFAIFDGHNGRKAAQYLSKHLINKLDELKTLTNNKQIQEIILSMDKQFCQSQHGQSGSTVVFAIVKPITKNNINNDTSDFLYKQNSNDSNSKASTMSITDDVSSDNEQYEIRVFWAGDSRAILIYNDSNNTFKELTCDHRPNNPSEKIRIETANGLIINNRVDSKLAVSRAFGDCNLKNNKSLKWEKQRVTSLMECHTTYAKKNDKLFLFCDGLVEYLENKQLIKLLFNHLNKYEDPVYGLGYLFDEILEGGSRDNMTAVIIHFKNANNYGNNGRHKTFLPGPLYMTRNDKKYVDAYLRNAKDFGHNDTPKLRRAAYREDLKFLRKYGMRGVMQQQLQYGKTAKSIITEIEAVIKEIDAKANDPSSICEMKQETNGSTEIIGTSTEVIDDNSNSNSNNKNNSNSNKLIHETPPLSEEEIEEEIKDQDDDLSFNTFNKNINNNININNEKIAMEKSLTHLETPLKRHNSIVVTPSVSPTEGDNNVNNSNSKKRTFNDMKVDDVNIDGNNNNNNNITNSANKRRKLNVGNAVKIHNNENGNDKNENNNNVIDDKKMNE